MLSKKYFIFLILPILLLCLLGLVSALPTNISACGTTISTAGSYILNTTIVGAGTCITIAQSNVNLNCNGYTISYDTAGTNSLYGINAINAVTPLVNLTVANCVIYKNTSVGTTSYGIQLTQISNSNIFNNTILTNGTSSNDGIYATTSCDNNIIQNNTIYAFGTTTGNIGVYLISASDNNLITGNKITANGTTTSYPVYISTNANNNAVVNNSLLAYSTTTSGAVSGTTVYIIESSNNNITGNYIYGNSVGTATTNYAVYLTNDANNNTILGNTINGNESGTTNVGVYMTYVSGNLIQGNNITVNGTTTLYGVEGSSANYNNITGNSMVVNGTSSLNGVYLVNSYSNIVNNNNVSVQGTGATNYGIELSSSYLHTVNGNNVSVYGTTGLLGIYATSTGNNNITGNSMVVNGTTTSTGIYSFNSYSNIVNNNNVSVQGTGATNYGIELSSSNLHTVNGNNVSVYGTTPLYGVYFVYSQSNIANNNQLTTFGTTANSPLFLSTNSNNNILSNNTLLAEGNAATNMGAYLTQSAGNNLSGNNITVNGTTTDYGIYLLTNANANTIINNVILVNGTTTISGILLSAATGNYIAGNNITANGTTQSGTTSNYGISVIVNSELNQINNNKILTGGGAQNYGLSLATNAIGNTFTGNNVTATGTSTSNYGVSISQAQYNTFTNNTITTAGTGTDHGFSITSSSTGNIMNTNNVTATGSTTSNGFDFLFVTPNYPQNNTLNGNIINAPSAKDLNFETAGINGTTLINQYITNYSFTGLGGLMNVINTSAGQINFLKPINGTNTTFSSRIFITNDFAQIDTNNIYLNVSSNITLYNLPTASTQLQIIRNNILCPSTICTNLTSMQAGNVTFNVTMYGNYSINSTNSAPLLVLNAPSNYFNSTTSQKINFNFTATSYVSPNALSCNLYIDSILNQTNSSVINNTLTNFLVDNISEGNHSWYINCFDSGGNLNISNTLNFNVSIPYPVVSLNNPSNNSYLNNITSLLLNYTVFDTGLRNMTVYLYADGLLINTSNNILNNTNLFYNLSGFSIGQHNWTVLSNNGVKNSSITYYYNVSNLTINCQVGGPYQSGSIVSVFGNISDGYNSLSSQPINITLYNSINVSTLVNSLSDGSFQTAFYGLFDGNYTLNTSFSYQGYNASCNDTFVIGTVPLPASLILDKLISLQVINSTYATYNITLNVANIGGSNATGVSLSDTDSSSSPYSLGNLTFGNTTSVSYIEIYQRNSTDYNVSLSIASVNGTDVSSGNIIYANSSLISILVPQTETGQQLTLIKNIVFNNQSSTAVNYTETLQVVNSGGVDLTGIAVNDTDLNLNTLINLNRTQSYSISGPEIINKTLQSQRYQLSIANATANSTTYQSNHIFVLVPALSSNASLLLSKSASLYSENSTNIVYNVTLSLTNNGDSNATNAYIYDADSPSSPYSVGTLVNDQVVTENYLLTYNETATSVNKTLSIATSNATDNLSENLIQVSSGQISLVIPPLINAASLVLNKITSLYNMTNSSVSYNVTLSLINNGESNATNLNITDVDSSGSPYVVGTLIAGNSTSISYIKTYQRNSTDYNVSLSIASVNGTDVSSGNIIYANSSLIIMIIPSTTANTLISLIKNAQYFGENSTSVTYNLTLSTINSGGIDLTGIVVNDTDLPVNTVINLNRTQSYQTSDLKTINKNSLDQQYQLSIANATYNSVTYRSNQISLLIPALANNASLLLSKSASLYLVNNTNIIYNVTLSLTNIGGSNATNVNITDSDSTNYNIGTLIAGQTITESYLVTLNRGVYLTMHSLSIATANGTDSISNNLIQVNSSQISVVIPALNNPASFVLSKIASFDNVTNTTISYNVTLILTNNGGSNATNVNITDSDSVSSPYIIGSLNQSQVVTESYIETFNRNSTTYFSPLSVAQVLGIDSYNNAVIAANSTQSNVTIPMTNTGQQLTVIKNDYYNSENVTSVNYTLSVQVVNSGGIDLSGIVINDQDLNLLTTQSINRSQAYAYSGSLIISKAASNSEHNFFKTTATANSTQYDSNQIGILIPGYGGPADTLVYSPASVDTLSNFDSVIEIKNQNPDVGQNFLLDYWITSNDGNTNYTSSEETLYIAASSSINVTVTLTSPDSPGIYKLMALVNYIGGPDMAFDSFEVNNPSPPEISSGSASLNGGGPVNLTQKYNCNMSYILYENECCLDQNNDSICDKYETQKLKIQNKNQTENYNSSEQNSSQNNIFYESVKTLFSDISIIYQSFKDKIDYQILVSVILILIISILIIANRKIILNIFKIHRLLCIFLSKNKKYPINSLNDLIGKKIYSEDGNYVGNVIDVTLEENKIDSLKVKIDKNNPFGTRGIIIKYKHVIGVGEVVFIDESISKHI